MTTVHAGEDPRLDAAVSLSTDPAQLDQLAREPDAKTRGYVARNPQAHPTTLAALSEDPSQFVRKGAAINESTPAHALRALVDDESPAVCQYLASNSAAPPDVLSRLARHEHWGVRSAVADNRSTPLACLVGLAGDEDQDVWGTALRNPALTADPELPAQRTLTVRAGILHQLTADLDAELVEGLAANWEGTIAELRDAIELV